MEEKPAQKIKVVQVKDAEVAAEVLAQAIVDIDIASKALLGAGLTKRALVILLEDATGVSRGNIVKVLNGLSDLQNYVNKKQ